MNKKIIIFVVVAVLLAGLIIRRSRLAVKNVPIATSSSAVTSQSAIAPDQTIDNSSEQSLALPRDSFQSPIDRAGERVTKKPFGIFITPQNSPVHPERFSGYHTGTDFETFPDEQNIDVPIYAITSGKIIAKKSASGYGGVLVESATINGSPVTIIYGHLKLASINKKTGDTLSP